MTHFDQMTDRLAHADLVGLVLAEHDREHWGSARFCNYEMCREAYRVDTDPLRDLR